MPRTPLLPILALASLFALPAQAARHNGNNNTPPNGSGQLGGVTNTAATCHSNRIWFDGRCRSRNWLRQELEEPGRILVTVTGNRAQVDSHLVLGEVDELSGLVVQTTVSNTHSSWRANRNGWRIVRVEEHDASFLSGGRFSTWHRELLPNNRPWRQGGFYRQGSWERRVRYSDGSWETCSDLYGGCGTAVPGAGQPTVIDICVDVSGGAEAQMQEYCTSKANGTMVAGGTIGAVVPITLLILSPEPTSTLIGAAGAAEVLAESAAVGLGITAGSSWSDAQCSAATGAWESFVNETCNELYDSVAQEQENEAEFTFEDEDGEEITWPVGPCADGSHLERVDVRACWTEDVSEMGPCDEAPVPEWQLLPPDEEPECIEVTGRTVKKCADIGNLHMCVSY